MRATALKLIVLALVVSGFGACQFASAQAAAETAGATSVAGSVAGSIKAPTFPKFPTTPAAGSSTAAAAPSGTGSSPHLVGGVAPAPQESNRKALEGKAGKDGGKLLLRSTPVEAEVWVNGLIVGKTPMLMVLAPGKYQVEMRGARGQTGKQSVDLLPRETREVSVRLEQLYPARVKIQQ